MKIIERFKTLAGLQDNKGMRRLLDCLADDPSTYSNKFRGLDMRMDSQNIYFYYSEGEVVFVLIDDNDRGKELADVDGYDGERPLWFSEKPHRVSPFAQINAIMNAFKEVVAVDDSIVNRYLSVLITTTHIINYNEYFDVIDRMDGVVFHDVKDITTIINISPKDSLGNNLFQKFEKYCSLWERLWHLFERQPQSVEDKLDNGECSVMLKDTSSETPPKELRLELEVEYIGNNILRSGIFECHCDKFFGGIHFVHHTEESDLVIPWCIFTPDFEYFKNIEELYLEDDNPVSPNVRNMFVSFSEDNSDFTFRGNLSLIFPGLENIIVLDNNGIDFAVLDRHIENVTPLIGDEEELTVIKDTPEYRESLLSEEELEDFRDSGCRYVIPHEQYVIKARHAEFLYIVESKELILKDIYGDVADEISIPRSVLINGKEVALTEISVCIEPPIEVLWVPSGCIFDWLSIYPPLKAIRFYRQ